MKSISVLRAGLGELLLQKMLVASLILAVLFASLPATHAYAAPVNLDNKNALRGEWRDKIHNVDAESFFYDRVRIYPADFTDPDEFAKASELLSNYGTAFRAAERLVFNHVGFDSQGQVVNESQANQTIKAVAENLRIMRVTRDKLDELDGEYTLLPRGSLSS